MRANKSLYEHVLRNENLENLCTDKEINVLCVRNNKGEARMFPIVIKKDDNKLASIQLADPDSAPFETADPD